MIGTRKAERILAAAEAYRVSFRVYECETNRLLAGNREDGTEVVQHVLDFFAASSRDFYRENSDFLQAAELDALLSGIQTVLDSGNLNDLEVADRSQRVRALADDEILFSKTLYESSLKF